MFKKKPKNQPQTSAPAKKVAPPPKASKTKRKAAEGGIDVNSVLEFGVTNTLARNIWYRRALHFLIRLCIVLSISTVACAGAAFWAFTHIPEPIVLAQTPEGFPIEITPINKPHIDSGLVREWLRETIVETFDLSYRNWQRRLGKVQNRYTDDGWQAFLHAMIDSGIIDRLETRRNIISAVVLEPPRITDSGTSRGIYTWIAEVPITITLEAGTSQQTQRWLVEVRIQRTPVLKNRMGIAIDQFVASYN